MLRTLRHYWRVNLAVALGAAVAAAVLSGALLVGDSVRGSLRDLTLDRLGEIDLALVANRFFREALAADLVASGVPEVAPVVLLRGAMTHAATGARASRTTILGVDQRFTALFGDPASLDFTRAAGQISPSVIVNEALQRELGVEPGDGVVLNFTRHSDVPRETLMGETDPDDVLGRLRLTVKAVIPDRGLGRFSVLPSQQTPLSAYVSLPQLQRALEMRGRANALFAPAPAAAGADVEDALRRALTLDDLGLRLLRRDDYLALESDEYVLRPRVDDALDPLVADSGAVMMRSASYLANRMVRGERMVPYSLVAAFDPIPGAPWATLSGIDSSEAPAISDDGILLNTWTAADLDAEVGDRIDLYYYVVGPREELTERSASFRVEGIVAIEGLGADRTLTPEYPGIQNADDMTAWDPPFPVDLDLIRKKDESYWDEHRATPKAFVALETGQRLWGTRFGRTTAARIGATAGGALSDVESGIRAGLRERLATAAFGLSFRPVKQDGLRAARGATDFAVLFVLFSQFLIVSAALLVGLLFRLGVEQRAGEIGLLLAVGHRVRNVRRGLLTEGAVLAAVGGLAGLAGGVIYAALMMFGLRTLWRPAVGTSELYLHVTPQSLVLGWLIALVVVLVSVMLAVRKLVRIAPQRLLAGDLAGTMIRKPRRLASLAAWGGLGGAVAILAVALATGAVADPGFAFGIGALLLISGLAFFSLWCRATRRRGIGSGSSALAGMAARNSSWNPARSILSVALVGCASFMVVVVGAFRGHTAHGLEQRDSAAGGFSLVAEADVPLHQSLRDPDDLFDLGFAADDVTTISALESYGFRFRPGDDTSCLNLYKPEEPRLLGVPADFVARGGFAFQQHLELPRGAADAWALLEEELEPGVIPAIADFNSAMWILQKMLGQELILDNERGEPIRLRLVGLLKPGLFQSELLISEQSFVEHFPGESGHAYFLIDTPPASAVEVSRVLEAGLASYGFDATTTREKIAGFKAVENTYMSTFQMLGGLGLLLGTVGLGIALVRNVIERRGELATLRAFGFRRSRLGWLIFVENAFLLLVGILVGTLAALAAAAPSLMGEAMPWLSLAATLVAVWAVGMLASVLAVRGAIRAPLLPALKSD